jgi:DNA polymerase III delta prime subunit
MNPLPLHTQTEQALANFEARPSHALVLSGLPGSGKLDIAMRTGERLMELEPGKLASYAYARIVSPNEGRSIGIEAVRELERFLSLKVPRLQSINRLVIISDAQTLTAEAQNALLKTIEEPPTGTILILTVSQPLALLPTIRSRAQLIRVQQPETATLWAFFEEQGFDKTAIKRAMAMSGGLSGLTRALLTDADHPLLPATEKARELLSQTAFQRLTRVDELAKDRMLCLDTLFIMRQMAQISLRTADNSAAKRWRVVLAETYNTERALSAGAQTKLALTSLMLSI